MPIQPEDINGEEQLVKKIVHRPHPGSTGSVFALYGPARSQISVRDLIEQLQSLIERDLDKKVLLAGCDCVGDADGTVQVGSDYILLGRVS
jgi:hypothetical protein